MLAMDWNLCSVEAPNEQLVNYETSAISKLNMTLLHVKNVVNFLTHIDENKKKLEKEALILRSIIYKYKNQFRNHRQFRSSRILLRHARKLSNVESMDTIGCRVKQLCPPLNISLPSRHLVHFSMFLTQRYAAVLKHIVTLCERSADMWLQYMSRGHYALTALAFLAVLSRIWDISAQITNSLTHIYACLASTAPYLQDVCCDDTFTFDLPVNLAKWLDDTFETRVDIEDKQAPLNETSFFSLHSVKTVICEETNECLVPLMSKPVFEPEIFRSMRGNRNNIISPNYDKKLQTNLTLCSEEDVGEVVRSDGVSSADICLYRKTIERTQLITSPKQIIAFIKSENKIRRAEKSDAITAKLQLSAWKEMKASLRKVKAGLAQWKSQTKEYRSSSMTSVREQILLWVLFPSLCGGKPDEWSDMLDELKTAI